jgi:hypothetical protein
MSRSFHQMITAGIVAGTAYTSALEKRKGRIRVMSDLLFNSNSDRAKLSDNLCSSTDEVDQVGKQVADTGTPGTGEVASLPELARRALPLPSPGESTRRTMGIAELASHCASEIHLYRVGEFQHETHCIELLRRATLQGDQGARKIVQILLEKTVRGWINQHPRREAVCSLDSEESYVTQAFARFYQLTVPQQVEFDQVSAALQYLKVCLNSVLLDRLRAAARPPAIPWPVSDDSGEPAEANSTDHGNVWEILSESFPGAREQRLAYLLFHCGLRPGEIVNAYPQEFHDVREISRLRHAMLERLAQQGENLLHES